MHISYDIIPALAAFALIALSSQQIGTFFSRLRLPLITGFLFAGLLAGPHVLGLISASALVNLNFLNGITLAFIAFAAGGELDLQELRQRFASIRWITLGLVVVTFSFTVVAFFLLADLIPFTRSMPATSRWAVALLAGAVLVARSPSSAIAVVNELRAKGPFTALVLGVTVVMDAVVIILFAINSSLADALLTDLGLNPWLLLVVLGELVLSFFAGYLLGRLMPWILTDRRGSTYQAVALLLSGYLVFQGTSWLRHASGEMLGLEIFLEPLLVCMVAAFVAANFTRCRGRFLRTLNIAGPPVYTVFFTLAGAALALDVLADTWAITLLLFSVRLLAIIIGSRLGGLMAGDPPLLNRVAWMGFVTQAGIGMGLAKELAVEFPDWGNSLATIIISVIVMNQIVGPPLFKWALHLVGEAKLGKGRRDLLGSPRAIIFGLDAQAIALARQLNAHGWEVTVASRKMEEAVTVPDSSVQVVPIQGLTHDALQKIGAAEATALVALLTDDENYTIASMAHDRFNIENVVVQVHDRAEAERLRAVEATPVFPETALVSLLDQFVRSPSAASLLLGIGGQEVSELVVRSPSMAGMALRDLHLPLDTLVLSVRRQGANLISHGYTRLELGDHLTVVGSEASMQEVALRLEH